MSHSIVGICGPTGSGKTTIANYLSGVFNTPTISFDNYYKKDNRPQKGSWINWEVPEAYNIKKLVRDTRRAQQRELVILEGFLIFSKEELTKLITHKIFIYLPNKEILKRRLSRYNKEGRNCNPEYLRKVLVAESKKYMVKQIQEADLVLDGRRELFGVTSEILTYLKANGTN